MENKSKIYFNGSRWKTNNYGYVEVVGKSNIKGYYLVKFTDGTIVEVGFSNIKKGFIKNPNHPNVYGIGFTGQGEHKTSINGKTTKEYKLWHSMFERCYSLKYHKERPTYIDCTVDPRWYNFQVFCDDIQELYGYINWKNNNKKNRYQLDKDKLIKGNKAYSKNNCCFITQQENSQIAHITGLTYVGVRKIDSYTEEFTNQNAFAKKYNLDQRHISNCIRGEHKSHKGWIFKVK